MSEELKPCPFCNGEGVIYEYSTVETCPCSMRPGEPAEAEGVVIAAKCVNRKRLRHNAMLSDYGLTLPHGEALVRQIDHLAALSAVTAERDRLRKANASRSDKLNEAQSIIDQLRAEVEALRKDAERYQWLIKGAYDLKGSYWFPSLRSYGRQNPTEAIDAAMAARGDDNAK